MEFFGKRKIGTAQLLALVVSAIAIRAFIEIFLSTYTNVDPYYLGLCAEAFMYLLIGMGCVKPYLEYYRTINNASISVIKMAGLTAAWAIVLLMFTYGSMALVVIVASHFNVQGTYDYFHFHREKENVHGFLSTDVLTFFFVTIFIVPTIEEIVFRGILLKNLISRYGRLGGAIIVAFVFTAFHFLKPDYIGTFVFSLAASAIYIAYGSIRYCILMHSIYNALAFIYQDYFGEWWCRSNTQLIGLDNWTGSLVLLGVSSFAIGVLFYIFRKYTAAANSPADLISVIAQPVASAAT